MRRRGDNKQCRGVEERRRGVIVRLGVLKGGGKAIKGAKEAINDDADALNGDGKAVKSHEEASKGNEEFISVHRRSKVSHCLSRVPSPFTAKGLCPFRNPINIVLEQPRAKNGSLFRGKTFFFC